MLELRVPVGMLCPLLFLSIRLETVAEVFEQSRYHLHTGLVALLLQGCDDVALASCRPQERRLRITPRRRFHQRLQVSKQRRVLVHRLFAPSPGSPAPPGIQGACGALLDLLHLLDPLADDAGGQAGCSRHRDDTPVPKGDRLTGREQPPGPLRQTLDQFAVPSTDLGCSDCAFLLCHAESYDPLRQVSQLLYFAADPKAIKIGTSANDPKMRLQDFQTGHPSELELIGYITGDQFKEKELHKQFEHPRNPDEIESESG